MPQKSGWSPLVKEWVEKENDCFGIYHLSDEDGTILYIGEGHVLTNLKLHTPEGSNPLQGATRYRVEYAGNERQAEVKLKTTLKEWKKEHGQLPRYNLLSPNVLS